MQNFNLKFISPNLLFQTPNLIADHTCRVSTTPLINTQYSALNTQHLLFQAPPWRNYLSQHSALSTQHLDIMKRILIIDDEFDIRAVAELALKAVGGWEVSTAASGSEGLQKAIAEQPNVILLDVMMPDMDGIATFNALQANPTTQSIPVILLTAKVQAADQRRFAELGVRAIITKPFKAMKLPAQISSALG